MSRLALIGGGVRSGKSGFAVELALARGARRCFLATAVGFDDEMRARIARHAVERGDAFITVEAPEDLDARVAALVAEPGGVDVVLVDCLTLWLSNLLVGGTPEHTIDERAAALAQTLRGAPFPTIVVTNEVGMGIVPDSALGRAFRDVAGRAHEKLARAAREIYLAALGTVLRLRPGPVEVVRPAAPDVLADDEPS